MTISKPIQKLLKLAQEYQYNTQKQKTLSNAAGEISVLIESVLANPGFSNAISKLENEVVNDTKGFLTKTKQAVDGHLIEKKLKEALSILSEIKTEGDQIMAVPYDL